jgi:hypothetical protein
VVRTRLLEPLGLRSTGFSVDDVPSAHLVGGYHRLGEAWVPEPFAAPGEFSPLGGLFSSVRDLATWVGGFTDAFPPRDDPESSHPLSRASRREMQQLQRFNDVTVPAQRDDSPAPPVRARVIGYGLGLTVVHDTRWGHIAGHSGGYPGYGSHMRWHPTTGIGVIALGNGRYTPASTPAAAALEIVLASVAAPSRRISRWSRTRELQRAAHQLVVRWDDFVADQIFAANVDVDLARDARRAEVLNVTEQLGTISPDADPMPTSATAAEIDWWITGEHGRARVELMLTPHRDPLVQEISVSFVGDVSSALLNAADNVAKDLQRPGDAATAEIECVEWQDSNSATFRIRLGVDEWRASVTVDAETGAVTKTTVTPTPPSAYRFDVAEDSHTFHS